MATTSFETEDNLTYDARTVTRTPLPGALVLFSVDRVVHAALPLRDGVIDLGRDRLAEVGLVDPRVSRRHAECAWQRGVWSVRDVGSRNGTSVDAAPCASEVRAGERAVVRVGDTIAWLVPDLGPYIERPVRVEGAMVVGATLAAVIDQIRAAADGRVLHITGPSGAGKELAARLFHDLGPRPKGPFVPINCAAIPEGVAERVLFGARKGAYSGAHADAPGHAQEADGGTLFLDEVGELDLNVQAKILRTLEAREVTPVGASRPVTVDVRFCSATHRDLRDRVSDKRFREDLYFRIARPVVALPPLRERREEIPTLVARELLSARLAPHASLIEACLVRAWPGNVRELIVEVSAAGRALQAPGDGRVRAGDLSPTAGRGFAPEPVTALTPEAPRAPGSAPAAPLRKGTPTRDEIDAALRKHGGRVATTARELGMHRNQLRRWLTAEKIDPRSYSDGSDPAPEEDDD